MTDRDGSFHDITLEVHAGEVFGLYGLGAGRSEWAGLLGLRPLATGEVHLDGEAWALPAGRGGMPWPRLPP
jgi:ribose transport system ATP-binding protein